SQSIEIASRMRRIENYPRFLRQQARKRLTHAIELSLRCETRRLILDARRSDEDLLDNLAMNVRQADISPPETVGELFVTEPKQIQDAGVKIINLGNILDRFHPHFVGRTID